MWILGTEPTKDLGFGIIVLSGCGFFFSSFYFSLGLPLWWKFGLYMWRATT